MRDTLPSAIGRIIGLWRYPVKSMAGEALEEIDISWHGFAGDRRWAFVRGGAERSGFPWLTIRERRDMVHYRPHLVEPDNPDKSAVRVLTPTGREYDIVDTVLAAELGPGVRVIKQDRGVFDTFPLSLITTQTIERLEVAVDAELDVQRFRPNLLIEATSIEAFPEDGWVGSVIRIGEATMRVDKRDKRCAVVNVDPATGHHDPATLRAIASTREGCLGVYGSIVQPGRVAIGDEVYIDE